MLQNILILQPLKHQNALENALKSSFPNIYLHYATQEEAETLLQKISYDLLLLQQNTEEFEPEKHTPQPKRDPSLQWIEDLRQKNIHIPILFLVSASFFSVSENSKNSLASFSSTLPSRTLPVVPLFESPEFLQQSIAHLFQLNQIATDLYKAQQELQKISYKNSLEFRQLLQIISHELRTPLRGITYLSEWLQEAITSPDKEVWKYLKLLRKRVQRLDRLFEALFQYFRVEKLSTTIYQFPLEELFEELLSDLEIPSQFSVEFPQEKLVLRTDFFRLKMVFEHLLENAVQFHPRPEGKIFIDWDSISSPNFYTFKVSDDGAGIPSKEHQRIFELFQVLQPRDEKETAGAGLSIAKKIVEQQGGKIWVESELQKHSTFYFTWPL